ncbi:MAG: hypothetical protein IPG53_06065 [Ignavibacteriales bacterium]|nr:hypothetical protein [Ignavibacteriales bacterium]
MKLKLLLLITLLAPVSVFAQGEGWDWSDFDMDIGWNQKKPYMSLSYGMSIIPILDYKGKLAKNRFYRSQTWDILTPLPSYGELDLKKKPVFFWKIRLQPW